MKLNQETWARIFPWLDKAQDVPVADLPAWIARIVAEQPEIGIPLREVLTQNSLSDDDTIFGVPLLVPPDRPTRKGQQVGAYTIDTLLAEGGMGEVWLAHRSDGQFEGTFAVKLLHLGTPGAKALDRFKREGRLLARLTHPHIARLIDAGVTADGQPFLVLEYIDGEHIDKYCQARSLSTRSRVRLFLDVLTAVAHAHTSLIIHRDIKPSNVLVTSDGIVKLLDFGIAKLIDPESTLEERGQLTRLEEVALTPSYAAPEQILGEPLSTATDVYQLGVLLHVLLAGGLPPGNVDSTRSERVKAALGDNSVRMSDAVSGPLRDELRGDLDAIIEKSLRTSASERYSTAAALAADLQRYLEHEPVTARDGLWAYRAGKFVRRHRVATAFIGMVTVLSVVASAAAWIAVKQKREAEHQRIAAEHQTGETLKAQVRSLTQAAAQRLKYNDVAGAQSIILALLTESEFAQRSTPATIIAFQEIRSADAQIAVLSGHSGFVYSAAYSPDGMRIVTASYDNTARIWDAHTGVQLALLSGHGSTVRSAVYSPDGTRIVTASNDKTARIWDARTGAQLAVLSGHGNQVRSAAYSTDGTRIVTASRDNTARIWDARTGTQLAVLSGHGDRVTFASYSPDGSRIVTASADKTARIWDAHTGAQLAVLSGHGGILSSVVYSPDGTRIVTASYDKTTRIWDARTGAQLVVLSGHGDLISTARYSPDGTRIVTASRDNTARIWDTRTGAQLTVLSGHGDSVLSAAYSPDGKRIVTASEDKTARVWLAGTGDALTMLSGHADALNSGAYSPDGNRVVTASDDKTVRVWDARTGDELAVLSGHSNSVNSAAYSPDGTRIVTASADATAAVWDAKTAARLAVLSGHGDSVLHAAYSPDGTRIVTASGDKTARIWDARTGTQLSVLSGHSNVVISAAFSPDDAHIVTASQDKTARVWDARTGAQLAVLYGHSNAVMSAAFSPDGGHIVTASSDKTARIWDARTGAQRVILTGHNGALYSAAYSPDGTRIVTASEDKTARIWDAGTGAQLAVIGHGDVVGSAAYSPDGSRIVTASNDKTARIWDAAIPANIAAQIVWDQAAETDPLPEVDRTELGLLHDPRVRRWGTDASACDQAAAAFYDPDRVTRGLAQTMIVADVAEAACLRPFDERGDAPREIYEAARALLAKSDVHGAKKQFESAVSAGYRVAQVDLANLLFDASAGIQDPERAVALDQEAWQEGIPIAASFLGHFYETGVAGAQPNLAKAWEWYERAANAGEPHALARLAERAERQALAEGDSAKAAELLLRAFGDYAAAAEQAYEEDWPDEAWRHWRYRRATLARLLATQGMMQRVADTYAAVLTRTRQ